MSHIRKLLNKLLIWKQSMKIAHKWLRFKNLTISLSFRIGMSKLERLSKRDNKTMFKQLPYWFHRLELKIDGKNLHGACFYSTERQSCYESNIVRRENVLIPIPCLPWNLWTVLANIQQRCVDGSSTTGKLLDSDDFPTQKLCAKNINTLLTHFSTFVRDNESKSNLNA